MSLFALSLDLMLFSSGLGAAHQALWPVPEFLTVICPYCIPQTFALGFLTYLLLKEKGDDEKFVAAFDGINLAMVLVDSNGNINMLNSSAESLVHYARAELLGRPIEELIPERFHAHHVKDRRAYSMGPVRRPMGPECACMSPGGSPGRCSGS